MVQGWRQPGAARFHEGRRTVDQATLKDAITIEGEPVSYTNDDSTRITEWLQNNWDKTIGN